MLALSGYAEWFWAILNLGKDIENRNWPTKVRGTIALHCSKSTPLAEQLNAQGIIFHTTKKELPESLPYGQIIGTVDIVDCVSIDELPTDTPWAFGRYCFLLANPRLLESPITVSGALNFWTLPPEIEFQIKEQLRKSSNKAPTTDYL